MVEAAREKLQHRLLACRQLVGHGRAGSRGAQHHAEPRSRPCQQPRHEGARLGGARNQPMRLADELASGAPIAQLLEQLGERDEHVRQLDHPYAASGKRFETHNPATGELREIIWNNTTLRDAAGNIIGAASIGEDVTERRRAEQALRSDRRGGAIDRFVPVVRLRR